MCIRDRFLKFCFSYDPAGRRYVLNTTSIGAVVILLAAGVFLVAVVGRGRKGKTKTEENA